MHVSPRTRSVSLALAAGSVPLLLALSLRGQPAPKAMPPKAGSPLAVAQALDAIVQPRFQDVRAGQFGLTRLVPAVQGHQSVGFLGNFETNNPAEAASLASANAAHRSYVMAFLHCAHVPGEPLPKKSQVVSAPSLLSLPSPSEVPPSFRDDFRQRCSWRLPHRLFDEDGAGSAPSGISLFVRRQEGPEHSSAEW